MVKNFEGRACTIGAPLPDGRIILKETFKQSDGQMVPVTSQYDQGNPNNVLGLATIRIRDDAIYAECILNNGLPECIAKHVEFGIYADKCSMNNNIVTSGRILAVTITTK